MADDQKRAQRPWLVVIGGKGSLGTIFEVTTKLTVGRSDEANIMLDEAGVSRIHANIELLPGNVVRVTDLGSSNGVRIDGRKVKTHNLREGERLRLGDAVLTLLQIDDDMPLFTSNLAGSIARVGKK